MQPHFFCTAPVSKGCRIPLASSGRRNSQAGGEMTARPFVALLLTFGIAFACTMPAAAISRSAVEARFHDWLSRDLWPDARRRGISPDTFRQAFAGVSLDWTLPDLVPPGTRPPERRVQSQAEFRSPGAYFPQSRLARWPPAAGRSRRAGRAAWRRSRRNMACRARSCWQSGAARPASARRRCLRCAFRVLATKAFMSAKGSCSVPKCWPRSPSSSAGRRRRR